MRTQTKLQSYIEAPQQPVNPATGVNLRGNLAACSFAGSFFLTQRNRRCFRVLIWEVIPRAPRRRFFLRRPNTRRRVRLARGAGGPLRRPPICSWASIARCFCSWWRAASASGCPTVDQLMNWGADNAGNVLIDGQWWRIVTAMFVHVGILHLATNMWCLWNLGLLAEPLMGSFGLFAVYILTGAAGNLLSTCYNWVRPMHDASGAPIFRRRRRSFRGRLRHRRRADRPAQVQAPAHSAVRAQASAQIRHLFRRDQPRHRPFRQLWQRIHRRGNR